MITPFLVQKLRVVSFLWLLATLASVGASQTKDDARPVEDASTVVSDVVKNPALPTIWLVGDSTVKVSTPAQRGWGEMIGKYFDLTKVNVVNRAIGGRSSRTFQTEGRWDKVLSELKAGDLVIIQFGHNDGGAINDDSRARGTIRGTGEETEEIDNILTKKHEIVHSYGWYLRKYIADTKAKRATPIICSLVPRKLWGEDGKIVRATDSYAAWAQQVAAAASVPFLDLYEVIAQHYERVGKETVQGYFADERTHTTPLGAQASAERVVAALRGLNGAPIDTFLSAEGHAVKKWER